MSTFKTSVIAGGLACFALQAAHAALPADLPLSYQVSTVSLKAANDLVFNASSQELLASIGSAAGYGVGNTITRIGLDGAILSSQFVGSEPGKIALSSDGSVGYVALQTAPSIKQFNTLTGITTASISVPGSAYNGSTRAEDIAVSPTDANVIAVSVRNTCCSPRHEGVYIIQNGQVLADHTPGHTGSNTIEFGANGTTLYGYNNETTEYGFRTMSVNSTGVRTTSVSGSTLYGFYQTFTVEQGLAYSSTGVVFNPSTGEQMGQFSLPYDATFAVSVADKRAYSLNSAKQLTVFDFDTFTPITTFDLSGELGDTSLSKLIYTKDGSLAAIGTNSIFVLSAVPEVGSMWMGALGMLSLAAAVRKARRQQARG